MEFLSEIKKRNKIKEFNPVQKLAIKNGLLEGKNLVVCAPTASGKTLIAEIAFLNNFFSKKGKSLYVVPLRALANEKYNEFKEKYEEVGLKIGISTGDFDSTSDYLSSKDLIILTSEKLDSLIRHNASWLLETSLLIIDEIHLLNDTSRGATLEMVITLMQILCKNLQILGLSATIGNPEELAKWLNANLVISDYRPIELKRGIFLDKKIIFSEEDVVYLERGGIEGIIKDTLNKGKQMIIFVNSRKNAESLAEKISTLFKKENPQLAKKILVLETPTKQCKKLFSVLKKGVAFHHAGLISKQREIIEEEFRKGNIKIICATPTLAAGVNLPAFRVLIRDFKRYEYTLGFSEYISNLEIQQMLGRAGRPKYDDYGEGIIYAKTENEAREIYRRYFLSPLEKIDSKLAIEPVLRTYILSLISCEFAKSIKEVIEIFNKTFFGYTFGSAQKLEEVIREIVFELEEYSFIKKEFSKIYPTKLGKRVSELYIDPLSAKKLIDGILEAKKESKDFSYLTLITQCYEMFPLPTLKKKEALEIEFFVERNKKIFLFTVPEVWDYGYDLFLRTVKLALILKDWIEEKKEDEILEKYGITPGELYQKINNSSWLLYSLEELSKILRRKEFVREIRKLRIRVENGIKEELLPLIRIPGIGRVKARRLYNANFKSLEDIIRGDKKLLSKLIGKKTLEKILS